MVNKITQNTWKNNVNPPKWIRNIPLKILGIILSWIVSITPIQTYSKEITKTVNTIRKKTWDIRYSKKKYTFLHQSNFKYPEGKLIIPERTKINITRIFNTNIIRTSIIKKLIWLWLEKDVAENTTKSLVKLFLWTQRDHKKWETFYSWEWTGFFIWPNIIVTAAHVLKNLKTDRWNMFYGIHGLNWKNYISKAIYLWDNEDIAFIIVEWKSDNYINLFQNNLKKWRKLISIWLTSSRNYSHVTLWNFEKNLRNISLIEKKSSKWKPKIVGKTSEDFDNDWIPFFRDYKRHSNRTIPWDSGGVFINEYGVAQCLITMVGFCEWIKDVKEVYFDFEKQAIKKWYKIKRRIF